jgi:hypothetical protein
MKKFLLVSFFLIGLASILHSQDSKMWIGGSLNFSTVDNDVTGQTNFGFMPELGINFSDHFAAGGRVGYFTSINKNAADDKQTTNRFSIVPFARYTFASFGKFNAFGQGELPLSFYGGENYDGTSMDSYNSIGINVRPGLSYSINEKWGLNLLMPSVLTFVTQSNNYSYFGFTLNSGYTIQSYLLDTNIGFIYKF